MANPGILHLHAQEVFHGDAFIVADKQALIRLRDLIDQAIQEGHGAKVHDEFLPKDGESFDLHVIVDDSDWQSDTWRRRTVPYTDELAAQQPDENVIYPWNELISDI